MFHQELHCSVIQKSLFQWFSKSMLNHLRNFASMIANMILKCSLVYCSILQQVYYIAVYWRVLQYIALLSVLQYIKLQSIEVNCSILQCIEYIKDYLRLLSILQCIEYIKYFLSVLSILQCIEQYSGGRKYASPTKVMSYVLAILTTFQIEF